MKIDAKMNLEINLNEKQGLYILNYTPIRPTGKLDLKNGFMSCHGFNVVTSKVEIIARYLWENGCAEKVQSIGEMSNAANPSPDYYAYYLALCKIADELHKETGARCNAELTPQLRGMEGKNVEVVRNDGETARFKVGKSTGWMPCHLEILAKGSDGGMSCDATYKSVRVIR